MSYEQILNKFSAAGQEHVLQFYPNLKEDEQRALLNALQNIDVERCNNIFAKSTKATSSSDVQISPLPASSFDSLINASPEKIQKWTAAGMKVSSNLIKAYF